MKSPDVGTAPRPLLAMTGVWRHLPSAGHPHPKRIASFSWRLAELEKAGIRRAGGIELAERSDVDLHFAVVLARSGCSASIALRILL